MSGLVVTALSAAVKVVRLAEDGKPMLRPSGTFTTDGKPILKEATLTVVVPQGDPLPEHLAKGELDRLKGLGHVGDPAKIADAAGGTSEAPLDLTKLGEYADDELAGLWAAKSPKVSDVLEHVGTDAALAAKALEAEKTATKGDGRTTLVAALEKVIADAAGGAS